MKTSVHCLSREGELLRVPAQISHKLFLMPKEQTAIKLLIVFIW